MDHVFAQVQAAQVHQRIKAFDVCYCIALQVQCLESSVGLQLQIHALSLTFFDLVGRTTGCVRAHLQVFELGDAFVLKVEDIIQFWRAGVSEPSACQGLRLLLYEI